MIFDLKAAEKYMAAEAAVHKAYKCITDTVGGKERQQVTECAAEFRRIVEGISRVNQQYFQYASVESKLEEISQEYGELSETILREIDRRKQNLVGFEKPTPSFQVELEKTVQNLEAKLLEFGKGSYFGYFAMLG